MAMSNAERQQQFRKRRRERAEANRERGRHRLEVWVSRATIRRLEALAEMYGSEQKAVETAIRQLGPSEHNLKRAYTGLSSLEIGCDRIRSSYHFD